MKPEIKAYLAEQKAAKASGSSRSERAREYLRMKKAGVADEDIPDIGKVDLLKSLVREARYNPWLREDLTPAQKARHAALQPALGILKAGGAFGQLEESAVAGGMRGARTIRDEVQAGTRSKWNPLNTIEAVMRGGKGVAEGLTTNRTQEIGDVLREEGVPDFTASGTGLLAAGSLPGISTLSKAATVPIKNAAVAVKKGGAALGRYSTKTHLLGIGLEADEAVKAIQRKFVDLPDNLTARTATRNMMASRLNAIRKADKLEDAVQKEFGVVAKAEANKIVPVEMIDEVGNNSITREAKAMMMNANMVDVNGNPIAVPGAAQVQTVLNKIDTAAQQTDGYISVGDVHGWMKELRDLAKNPAYKEFYAIANQLRTDLAKHMRDVSPAMGAVSRKYSKVMRILHGRSERAVGSADVLHMSQQGTSPILDKGYYSLNEPQRMALEKLAKNIPGGDELLEDIQRKSYVSSLSTETAKKGASLAALGTFAVRAPWMIPILAGAGAAVTPRSVGKGYQALYRKAARVSAMANKPIAKESRALMERFVGASAVHSTTREFKQ